jgi:hypothetical protein
VRCQFIDITEILELHENIVQSYPKIGVHSSDRVGGDCYMDELLPKMLPKTKRTYSRSRKSF